MGDRADTYLHVVFNFSTTKSEVNGSSTLETLDENGRGGEGILGAETLAETVEVRLPGSVNGGRVL
jgi:hypothetical protein